MELLTEILQKLNNQEIKRVKSQIKNHSHSYEKVGKLFELITRFPGNEENFYSQKLYKEDAGNVFRVTKARLKRMLEEVLLNDKSLREYEAEYITAYLLGRKKLLQGEILMGRGAYAASRNLLEQVIISARKYCFQDELFEASLLLFRHDSTNLPAAELIRKSEELTLLSRESARLHQAAVLYYQFSGLLATTTLKEASEFAHAASTVAALEEIYKETKSPTAGFYYLKAVIYYDQVTYEFESAMQHCRELLKLVQEEPAIRSKQREGATLLQLAEVCLRSGDLEGAESNASLTQKIYDPGELNYLIALETSYRIAFFRQELTRCRAILTEALNHPGYSISKLRQGKWKYFEAALAFREKKYKDTTFLLNEATPVLADKMGWNIAFRLLEIMSLFEAGQSDLIESKVENIRQFAKRNKHDADFARAQLLIDLLTEWNRNRYNFKATASFIAKQLERIHDYHLKVPFNPASFELIRFEQWIAEKSGETLT